MTTLIGAHPTFTTADQRHGLGDRTVDHNGNTYVYVQASGAITQYDAVGIDEDYQAAALTDTLAGAGHVIGFAQVAFADNDYGWVAIDGTGIRCRVAGSCAADAGLFSFTTSGVLDDATSAGAIEIHGVVAVAANGAGTDDVEIIARAPYAARGDL